MFLTAIQNAWGEVSAWSTKGPWPTVSLLGSLCCFPSTAPRPIKARRPRSLWIRNWCVYITSFSFWYSSWSFINGRVEPINGRCWNWFINLGIGSLTFPLNFNWCHESWLEYLWIKHLAIDLFLHWRMLNMWNVAFDIYLIRVVCIWSWLLYLYCKRFLHTSNLPINDFLALHVVLIFSQVDRTNVICQSILWYFTFEFNIFGLVILVCDTISYTRIPISISKRCKKIL